MIFLGTKKMICLTFSRFNPRGKKVTLYVSKDICTEWTSKRIILVKLDGLQKQNDKRCRDTVITPRKPFLWQRFRTFWINVYHNNKIRLKERGVYAYCLVYSNKYRNKIMMGENIFPQTNHNKKVKETMKVKLWKRELIWLILSSLNSILMYNWY